MQRFSWPGLTSRNRVWFTQLVLRPQWVLIVLHRPLCKYLSWHIILKGIIRSFYFHLLLPISISCANLCWARKVSLWGPLFPSVPETKRNLGCSPRPMRGFWPSVYFSRWHPELSSPPPPSGGLFPSGCSVTQEDGVGKNRILRSDVDRSWKVTQVPERTLGSIPPYFKQGSKSKNNPPFYVGGTIWIWNHSLSQIFHWPMSEESGISTQTSMCSGLSVSHCPALPEPGALPSSRWAT